MACVQTPFVSDRGTAYVDDTILAKGDNADIINSDNIRTKKRRRKKLLRKRQCLYNNMSQDMHDRNFSMSGRCLPEAQSRSSDRLIALASPNPRQITSELSVPVAFERRKKVPLLSAIKPENEKMEKERFMRANANYNPLFVYKSPPEADVLNKFTNPSNKFLPQAILIMKKAITRYGSYEEFEEQTGGKILTRAQIYILIKKFLKKEELETDVYVNLSDDLISRGSMTRSKGRPVLNVRTVNLREQWAEGLLRHEIGTHYLRSYNNRCYIWNNFKTRNSMGLGPVNPTEEGLASLHSVLFRPDPCLWRAALLYYTAYQASKMSFKELFRDLGAFVRDRAVRWDYCLRAKRGQVDTSYPGGFCKDQVYLEGALKLLKRRRSLNFNLLIRLGKISYEDLDLLQHEVDFENTRVPHFMYNMTVYRQCIDRIAVCNGLTDEVLADVD